MVKVVLQIKKFHKVTSSRVLIIAEINNRMMAARSMEEEKVNEEVLEISNREIKEDLIAIARVVTMQANLNMTPMVVERTMTSRLRDFERMNRPIFIVSKVNEDPHEFLDGVYKVLSAIGVTPRDKGGGSKDGKPICEIVARNIMLFKGRCLTKRRFYALRSRVEKPDEKESDDEVGCPRQTLATERSTASHGCDAPLKGPVVRDLALYEEWKPGKPMLPPTEASGGPLRW
ncbi:hypothetical protein EJD97_014400 [Solanum chilense]|uniref:Gag-pol polyprotein n=1 Tax=Solanum chilense TaxID=4083 RepID=A0A6N2CAZ8_SOLCI|nr:hypothetical protein EJD97_014400 [Solanum chilense]